MAMAQLTCFQITTLAVKEINKYQTVQMLTKKLLLSAPKGSF